MTKPNPFTDAAFLKSLLSGNHLQELDIPTNEELGHVPGHIFAQAVASSDFARKEEQLGSHAGPEMQQGTASNCDVLIVCPLAKEQEMTCLAFNVDPKKPDQRVDGTKEYHFELPTENREKPLRIVLTALNRQTNINSASRTPYIIQRHAPQFAFLTGIGATFPKKTKLGHVVGGFFVYYLEGGSRTTEGKKPRPIFYEVHDGYQTLLDEFDNKTDEVSWKKATFDRMMGFREKILHEVPSKKELTAAKVEFEVKNILSGEELRKDDAVASEAESIDQRIRSVEMEAAGFAAACKPARVPWMVFRSHCDHADPDKNDRWQRIAALNSALCVRSFLETEFLLPEDLNLGID